ncbi:hypothetical protein Q8A67_023136 [Cirrhinus molitorella]|uniref:Uncharacterized protein n=1 Tax=Cirrhinus molitorella TaxID=172907 RepID=A0AA88TKN1_9TELE|nr:hypothetical protein Q8A67_023136 [Cirrhinus molitorella]
MRLVVKLTSAAAAGANEQKQSRKTLQHQVRLSKYDYELKEEQRERKIMADDEKKLVSGTMQSPRAREREKRVRWGSVSSARLGALS